MDKEKIWTKGFTTITVSHAAYVLGSYMLIPTIPLYLVSLGATESQVGMIATAFFVASIVTRLFLNVLLKRTGRKRVLMAGMLLTAIAMLLYGLLASIVANAALRFIGGVGFGITTTIATAMAADFLPDSRRGQGIGYFTMGYVVAMTAAPALAIFLREKYGFPPVFYIASGFALLAAILLIFAEEPPPVGKAPAGTAEHKESSFQWRNLFDSKLIVASCILLLFSISRSGDSSYIALFAAARNLNYLSLYFVIQTVTMFFVRFVIGRIIDRKGRNWVLIPGGFAMLALCVTLSFTYSDPLLLVGAFFSGLAVGVISPSMQVWMFGVVAPEKRNVASATYYNFTDIGVSIGSLLMGFTAENYGYTVMYRFGACVALLYLLSYFIFGRERTRKSL